MEQPASHFNRRSFLKTTTALTGGFTGLLLLPQNVQGMEKADEGPNIIGPKKGYSPQIGTLVSMMEWMRMVILGSVRNLTVKQLDYVHDPKANTIGSLLLHLAALERYYQLHTFEGRKWGDWDVAVRKQWDMPLNLGEKARKGIKGKELGYYLNTLKEVRENTMQEFKKRDDKWLMTVDKEWSWGPTNNYCKWFHVCEHESNHNGQIKWILSRISGADGGKD